MISLVEGLYNRHGWQVTFRLTSVAHQLEVTIYEAYGRLGLLIEGLDEGMVCLIVQRDVMS